MSSTWYLGVVLIANPIVSKVALNLKVYNCYRLNLTVSLVLHRILNFWVWLRV